MIQTKVIGRYDLHGRHTVLLLTCHDELAEAHGKINGIKSLCTGSVLKYGVRDYCDVCGGWVGSRGRKGHVGRSR